MSYLNYFFWVVSRFHPIYNKRLKVIFEISSQSKFVSPRRHNASLSWRLALIIVIEVKMYYQWWLKKKKKRQIWFRGVLCFLTVCNNRMNVIFEISYESYVVVSRRHNESLGSRLALIILIEGEMCYLRRLKKGQLWFPGV